MSNRQKYYVYRFLNESGEIIYVGRTNNLNVRIYSQHFRGGKPCGHLPKECYRSTHKIEYTSFKSKVDCMIYELYFIANYCTKFNTMHAYNQQIETTLPEVNWKQIKHPVIKEQEQNIKPKKTEVTDDQVINYLKSLKNNKYHTVGKDEVCKDLGIDKRQLNKKLKNSSKIIRFMEDSDIHHKGKERPWNHFHINHKEQSGKIINPTKVCTSCANIFAYTSNRQKYCKDCALENERSKGRERARRKRNREIFIKYA